MNKSKGNAIVLTPVIFLIAISVFITNFAIFFSLAIAQKYDIYDYPEERKIHHDPVPRTGGIAIFISFLTLALSAKLWKFNFFIPFLISNFIIFLTGLLDDKYNLSATKKLIMQFLGASIIIFFCGIRFKIGGNYTGFLNLEIASIILTYLWIIGVTNAINLTDGMDGLASGISLFAFGGILLIALSKGNFFTAVMSSIFLGSLITFLSFNLPKAIIFLGDCGSLLLGFNIAVLSLNISYKTGMIISVIFPSLFVLIPVIDTALAFFRRLLKGQNPINTPDKKHIHHKLILLKFSYNQALIIFYTLSGIFTTIAITFKSKNLLNGIIISLTIILIFLSVIYFFEKNKVDRIINNFNKFTNNLKNKLKKPNKTNFLYLSYIKIVFLIFYAISIYTAFTNPGIEKYLKYLFLLLMLSYLSLLFSGKTLKTVARTLPYINFWINFFSVYFLFKTNLEITVIFLLLILFPFFLLKVFVRRNFILIFPSPTDILLFFTIINICLFIKNTKLYSAIFAYTLLIYLFQKAIFKELEIQIEK